MRGHRDGWWQEGTRRGGTYPVALLPRQPRQTIETPITLRGTRGKMSPRPPPQKKKGAVGILAPQAPWVRCPPGVPWHRLLQRDPARRGGEEGAKSSVPPPGVRGQVWGTPGCVWQQGKTFWGGAVIKTHSAYPSAQLPRWSRGSLQSPGTLMERKKRGEGRGRLPTAPAPQPYETHPRPHVPCVPFQARVSWQTLKKNGERGAPATGGLLGCPKTPVRGGHPKGVPQQPPMPATLTSGPGRPVSPMGPGGPFMASWGGKGGEG